MKYTYLLIAFFCSSYASSQQCYDPGWDWENPEAWKIYYPEGVQNYSPFNTNRASVEIKAIIENHDLKKENGWVLLYKNLGCEAISVQQPRVIFYNKFRSVVRVMAIHRRGEKASSGLLQVEWGNGNSSLLTHSNFFASPNSSYPEQENDKVINVIDSFVSADDAWWVSDFQVAFDHRTTSNQSGRFLSFKTFNIVDSEIKLEGTVDLVSKSMQLQGAEEGSSDGEKKNWLVKGVKSVQKLNPKDWEGYLSKANETFTKINQQAVDKWEKNKAWAALGSATGLLKIATSGEGKLGKAFSKLAEGAGIVGSVLGFAADLFNIGGKASSTPAPIEIAPFVTTGTISQSGTIVTKTDEENYTMDLPGTRPVENVTYYSCPLGVLNLKDAIEVDKRVWNEEKMVVSGYGKVTTKTDVKIIGFTESSTKNPSLFFRSTIKKSEKWKSIKLSNNITMAVNNGSGLQLVSAVVAFQGKVRKHSNGIQGKGIYDLFEPYTFLPSWYSSFSKKSIIPIVKEEKENTCAKCPKKNIYTGDYKISSLWKNKTFDYINDGTYKMVDGGEDIGDGRINELYTFRTGYVDINKSKDLVFTVRNETDITLKLIAVFKEVANPNAPMVTFTKEYNISEPLNGNDNSATSYPFIRDQFNEVKVREDDENTILVKALEDELLYPYKSSYNRKTKKGTTSPPIIPKSPLELYEHNKRLETQGNKKEVYYKEDRIYRSDHAIYLMPGFEAYPISKVNEAINESEVTGSFTAKVTTNSESIKPTVSVAITDVVKYYKDGVPYATPQVCDCIPEFANVGRKSSSYGGFEPDNQLFTLYPNPALNQINIDFTRAVNDTGRLVISNILGAIVLDQVITSENTTIDIQGYNAGVFVITVYDGTRRYTQKLVKQ